MDNSGVATLVKEAVDIVDVIGQVVPLRRNGNRHLGLCPFHQEKTPSFHVDAQNQFYYCFGCGSGGDVLSFVMKYRNLAFGDALRYLAERYNILLPEKEHNRPGHGGPADAARKERHRLYGVLRIAADYFYEQLHHSPAGLEARDYIARRRLPPEVVEAQRLGFAPPRWDGLLQHLRGRGVDLELGLKAGLLARSSRDTARLYDRFRNRLIFPITDDHNRIIAFGGRVLAADSHDEPKYLNSPETPVYHKGRTLYQLARAREACRQVRQVVLVEGYMDLLAFHSHGFFRVVATLGTALTPYQVRLLARMSDEVVLAYDGDEAGEKAMLRALPLFLQEEVDVRSVTFPAGEDPDDFLRAHGIAGFERLLDRRQDLGTYAICKILEGWDGSTGGKSRILAELRTVLAHVRRPLPRSEYIRLVCDRLSLSEELVRRELDYDRRRNPTYVSVSAAGALPKVDEVSSLEEKILRVLIKYPALIEEVKGSEAPAYFEQSTLKTIIQALIRLPATPGGSADLSIVYDALQDTDARELFARLLMESCELSEPEVHLKDWLEALTLREKKQKRADLDEALRQAVKNGDSERVKDILAKIQGLSSAGRRVRDLPDNL